MAGFRLQRIEVKARVKFNDKEVRNVYVTFDNKILRMYTSPCGYIIVVDDDYLNQHDVIWGDTPEDALQAYYDVHKDIYRAKVLEVVKIRSESPQDELEEEEEDIDEEEFWELADIETLD